jgi:flagellar assembly protein FliH
MQNAEWKRSTAFILHSAFIILPFFIMGLIKSANAPTTLSPFSLKDVEDHARQLLLRARKQAEQLLIEAQQESEKMKAEAKAFGMAEGTKAGFAEGNSAGQQAGRQQALAEHGAALTALLKALTTTATEIDASRHQLDEEAENAVVKLALAITRKVTKLQGERDSSVVLANVDAAARMVNRASDVRLSLHPSQRQTLLDALPALKMQWPSLSHVELVDDPTIAPGGCRIRTRGGLIDADLDRQVDQIAKELLPNSGTGIDQTAAVLTSVSP